KSTLQEPKMSFSTNEFYLKDSEEMTSSFSEWPEAIASSLEIAERCNVQIELGKQLIPRYPTPDGEDEVEYLRRLAHEGLRARYGSAKYGPESVAQIITFGRMFPRAATRDAARVLGYDYGAGDRLAKMIPDPIMGRAPSFEECLKPGEELAKAYESEEQAKAII